MATQIQWRRGSTAQTASFTGAVGEATVDTSKNTFVIHDGITAGGFPLARESALSANASQIQASFNQANIAFIAATSAGIYANGAFVSSNTIQTYVTSANANISLLFSYVNTANANITAAFAAAGSAGVYANAAFIHANASFAFANTISGGAAIDNVARSLANTAVTLSAATDATQNANITSVTNTATAAFLAANTAATLSDATDATQNNSITAAFTQANTAVLNAGNASIYANGAFLAANSAATLSAATDATQNTNITNAQNTGDAAFLAANSAATLSAATDATQNNSITAAFLAANSAATLSAATDATQNNSIAAAFTQANSVYLPSVTRLDVTNAGAGAYLFDQYAGNNPELYIRAGETLAFNLNVTGHPFLIRVSNGGSNYSNGLTHVTTTGTVTTGSSAQGQVAGTLYWKVPAELAGNTYVYQCQVHGGMVGNIVIERPNHDFTNISVAAGTYGNATHYGVVSVAANGRVTSVSTFPVVDSSAIAFSIALG
jgi:hypothetical protein